MSQSKKTRTTVDIYGKTYTIVGNESVEHVRHITNMVNDKMKEIYQANKSLDTNRLAVLTAVNITNDYVKIKDRYDELVKKIAEKEDA